MDAVLFSLSLILIIATVALTASGAVMFRVVLALKTEHKSKIGTAYEQPIEFAGHQGKMSLLIVAVTILADLGVLYLSWELFASGSQNGGDFGALVLWTVIVLIFSAFFVLLATSWSQQTWILVKQARAVKPAELHLQS